jgi:magnesium transporter
LQASESLAEVIENTVGEMMDPALAVLPQTTTVQEAIAFPRNHETPQQIICTSPMQRTSSSV